MDKSENGGRLLKLRLPEIDDFVEDVLNEHLKMKNVDEEKLLDEK